MSRRSSARSHALPAETFAIAAFRGGCHIFVNFSNFSRCCVCFDAWKSIFGHRAPRSLSHHALLSGLQRHNSDVKLTFQKKGVEIPTTTSKIIDFSLFPSVHIGNYRWTSTESFGGKHTRHAAAQFQWPFFLFSAKSIACSFPSNCFKANFFFFRFAGSLMGAQLWIILMVLNWSSSE